MSNTASAAGAALSIDQAVALMNEGEHRKNETEPGHTAETAGNDIADMATDQPTAVETRTDEESPDASGAAGGDKPAGAQEETEAVATRDPPSHWNAEERAIFAKQSPEVQEAILAQEAKRESVLQRAKLDAANAEHAARTRETELGRRTQALDALLQPALQTFQSRWANIDWSELPDRIGADQTLKLRAQFENEQAMIHRLAQEQQQTETERHRSFVASESERLKTEAPDLVDPREGKARVQALAQFLVSEGFPAERLSMMSAKEAAIAYDAMRWRQAEAKAKATQKPAAQRRENGRTAAAAVRPTAAQSPRTPQSKADDAMRRLAKTGRIDDAVAFLNLRSP